MSWRWLVSVSFLTVFASCAPDGSPVASTNDSSPESEYYAAKPASHDAAMYEFQRAYDQVWKIITGLKRYTPKGPNDDRHDEKVKGQFKKLDRAQRRLDSAFKNVRYERSAQADMRAVANYRRDVIARLGRYNLSYGFMINPCILPWIGEYFCGYNTLLQTPQKN